MNQNKILLIEDDKEISEMLKNYLTVENYEVICAYDGQEASVEWMLCSILENIVLFH